MVSEWLLQDPTGQQAAASIFAGKGTFVPEVQKLRHKLGKDMLFFNVVRLRRGSRELGQSSYGRNKTYSKK